MISACTPKSTIKESSTSIGYAVGIAADVALLASGGWLFAGVGSSIGAVGGAAAGELIEYVLTKDEQSKVVQATKKALDEKGDAEVSWKSDENETVSGRVQTAEIQPKGSAKKQCKRVTQIVNISGQESRETIELCRQIDGSWS